MHTAGCNSAQATCMYVRRIPPHKSPQCAPFMAHAACVCVVVLNVCICARSARNIRIIACPWTSDDDDVPREGCGVRRQGLRSQELPAAPEQGPEQGQAPRRRAGHKGCKRRTPCKRRTRWRTATPPRTGHRAACPRCARLRARAVCTVCSCSLSSTCHGWSTSRLPTSCATRLSPSCARPRCVLALCIRCARLRSKLRSPCSRCVCLLRVPLLCVPVLWAFVLGGWCACAVFV